MSISLTASHTGILRPKAEDWDGPVIKLVQAAELLEPSKTSSHSFTWSIIEQGIWIAILEGEIELRTPSHSYRVRAGEAIAVVQPIQATFAHVRGVEDVRMAYISFAGEFAISFFSFVVRRFGLVQPFDQSGAALRRVRRIHRLLRSDAERDARFWSLESFQFLNEWWAEAERMAAVARPTSSLAPQSQLAVNHGGSVKRLAASLGYSYSHAARTLKRILRTKPGLHLRKLRLEEGARLLRSSTLPIGEIATKIGFGGASAFGFAFRKVNGQSPREYRHAILHRHDQKLLDKIALAAKKRSSKQAKVLPRKKK